MLFRRLLLIMFILCGLFSCASLRQQEELQLGKMDFQAGNYKKAFRELLPLAVDGHADAQYAVGYMYYYGEGVAQDTETGIFWMKKSAAQHYKPAEKALMKLNKR